MTSKDLIYRQQAISALGEEPEVWMDDDDYTLGQRNQWRYDVTALKAVPSAQSERKKGRCVWCSSPFRIEYYWIDREGNTASFQDEECHVVATGIANFCPNCGADMRGEQE